ncbi:MAG: hypothetical protein ACXV2C_06790 [Candidatus Bathyarchaeia archaeon]
MASNNVINLADFRKPKTKTVYFYDYSIWDSLFEAVYLPVEERIDLLQLNTVVTNTTVTFTPFEANTD